MNKRKSLLVGICVFVSCLLAVVFIHMSDKNLKVELQDLYGDIIPYQSMSYGDSYIADKLFDSLVRVSGFDLKPGIASNWDIDGSRIIVTLSKESFKLPNSSLSIDADYIVDYYVNVLMRLSESSLLLNPGIKNLASVEKMSNTVVFTFNDTSATNILALNEKLGYEDSDGLWYGSLNKIVYSLPEIKLGSTVYITSSTQKGLSSQTSERITTQVVANFLNDGTLTEEKIPNNTYGFLSSGKGTVITSEQKQLILRVLSTSDIRTKLSLPSDSVYSNTSLYSKPSFITIPNLLQDSGLLGGPSIRIGVVDMGSFNEITDALDSTLKSLKIPAIVEDVDLQTLLNSEKYDLIYIRIAQGLSPNITGLFNESSLLYPYADKYKLDIDAVNNSTSWENMCVNSKLLMDKLLSDAVLIFLDTGFDIKAIP